MTEKLQKILANAGLGSRREIERWIQQGRVKIEGRVAKIGDRSDVHAKICIDGKTIKLAPSISLKRRVLIYYKPEGEICTRVDPQNRLSVFAKLPPIQRERWIMIGRLDINTSGLLLFTNDGEFAHRLAHPSYAIEREYAVRVLGKVDVHMLKCLKEGVQLKDGKAAFMRIEERGGEGINRWYHVVLQEGRNREVRRLWESQGMKVSRLIRVRFGELALPTDLKRGQLRELLADEVSLLAKKVGLN